MGKGSKQRPTNHDRFSENFDSIFRKKDNEEYKPFKCDYCGGLDRDDVIEGQIIDREPFGDQTVDRFTYYYECAICGSDDVEENEFSPPD